MFQQNIYSSILNNPLHTQNSQKSKIRECVLVANAFCENDQWNVAGVKIDLGDVIFLIET